MIREAVSTDLAGLLRLYTHLHEDGVPEDTPRLQAVWRQMLADPNHHIFVAEEAGQIVSACTCVIVPNLTRGQRPYALVENVVTDAAFRGRGLATACLHAARELAKSEDCYKIMLLTGSKEPRTLDFYRRAGYNDADKTAFIQWL